MAYAAQRMLDPSLNEIAERALAEELELSRVIVTHDRVVIADSGNASETTKTTLTLMAVCNGRPGVASMDASGGEKALEEAVELAHERAEWNANAHGSGPLESELPVEANGWQSALDEPTAVADPGLLAELAASASASQTGTSVMIVSADMQTLVAARGFGSAEDRRAAAAVRATTLSSGCCSAASSKLAALDPMLCAQMAFMHGEYGVPAISYGSFPAIIGSEALAAIIDFVAAEFVADNPAGLELGAKIAAAGISLSDAPLHPGTLQRRLDDEGSEANQVTLIERGTASGLVSDLLTSANDTTGHARSPFSLWAPPRPGNLVLAAGDAADERAMAAEDGDILLISAIESLAREPNGTISATTAAAEIKVGGEVRFVGPLHIGLSRFGGLEHVTAMTSRQDLHVRGDLKAPREWRSVLCPSARLSSVELRSEA